MGKHYLMSHPEIKEIPIEPFKFEVLKVYKDYADRMIWQSLYIKQVLPKINTQLSPVAVRPEEVVLVRHVRVHVGRGAARFLAPHPPQKL